MSKERSDAAKRPLDPRVGHQAMATPDGFCKRECPYLQEWEHPFYRHGAWCWKQMRNLCYYDGLIADCLHREPDENLARLSANMMPNVIYPSLLDNREQRQPMQPIESVSNGKSSQG